MKNALSHILLFELLHSQSLPPRIFLFFFCLITVDVLYMVGTQSAPSSAQALQSCTTVWHRRLGSASNQRANEPKRSNKVYSSRGTTCQSTQHDKLTRRLAPFAVTIQLLFGRSRGNVRCGRNFLAEFKGCCHAVNF